MMISAATLRFRATIQRPGTITGEAGRSKGALADVPALSRVPAGYRELTLRDHQLGNGEQGAIDAEASLRDCAAARLITNQDRFVLHGAGGDLGFKIVSVGVPGAQDGLIRLQLKKLMG